jgi:4-hydroxybenzoate polyprenyltransferase
MTEPPLVVDLDGTLVRSDVLLELALAYIRHYPLGIFYIFMWWLQGHAILKCRLAAMSHDYLDVAQLPYTPEVMAFIQTEKSKGRLLILATGSPQLIAQRIASYLGCFNRVLATDETINLVGNNKSKALISLFGEKKFDYMGNAGNDFKVWEAARYAYVVNPTWTVRQRLPQLKNCKEVFNTPLSSPLKLWFRQLRCHQWFKNILIFVPLFTKYILEISSVFYALGAFIFWSLCASGLYVLNDLLDITHDRHHPQKSLRPFAAGDLSPLSGLIISFLLISLSVFGAALLLPFPFCGILSIYAILSIIYTLYLKKKALADVFSLSTLYTLRIIGGAYACTLPLSSWTLIFSLFLFLSLAFIKRYSELGMFLEMPGSLRGRDYSQKDQPVLGIFGIAAGYVSVLIFGLYSHTISLDLFAYSPGLMWIACGLLLFWISHLWLSAYRGHMHDDPFAFALKDMTSLITLGFFLLTLWFLTHAL